MTKLTDTDDGINEAAWDRVMSGGTGRKIPIGRTTSMSMYSPCAERPHVLHGTWLESESFAYPANGFTRRAYVELRANPHNPLVLPYGTRRVVTCKCADTYFSIPARLRIFGKTVHGFISVQDADSETARYTFTPDGEVQS